VAILDTRQRYSFANRQHGAWFGIDAEALTDRHIVEVIGESAWQELESCYQQALAGETSQFSGELHFAKHGMRFVQVMAMGLPSETGDIDSVLLLCTDLTELTTARRALDASSVRSQTILDTAVDGIVTIDEDGVIQSCNASTERLFGYTVDELTGRKINLLMPEHYAVDHDNYIKRYLDTGEKRIIGIGREVTAMRKGGTQFPIHLAVGEFIEGGRHFFTGFIRDMTPQKQAEQNARAHLEQLAHVSRLSAIDNLASGLSHEINQPLTAIVTMSQALLRGLRAGKKDQSLLEDTLERIVHQGARANSIVQQMREHTRRNTSIERSAHQLDDIIVDVLKLLESETKQHDIRVETNLNTGQSPVMVNRIQIEQVVLNLIQNAVHAMADVDGDRVLTITSNPPADSSFQAEVLVSDTGTGLPVNDEGKVFDPFFTTKDQGMGQGLSISRTIIEAHGGLLIGGSNHSGGALFKFTLPAEAAGQGSGG